MLPLVFPSLGHHPYLGNYFWHHHDLALKSRALSVQSLLEFIRVMPQLVLLFLVYFGLARNFDINISGELSAIIVFSLWGTAEMGDLVRGAITSLPKHQFESGQALGRAQLQLYVYIIIPQVLRRLLPQAINLITRMIKTTSLIVLIGVIEVVKVGQQIIDSNRLSIPSAAFWIYGCILLLYFAVCFPISKLSSYLETIWKGNGHHVGNHFRITGHSQVFRQQCHP